MSAAFSNLETSERQHLRKVRHLVLHFMLVVGLSVAVNVLWELVLKPDGKPDAHVHAWGQWGEPSGDPVSQYRKCTECGLAQKRKIETVK